jgi:hypothetical protein
MPRLRRAKSGAVGKKHIAVLCFSGADAGHTLEALGDFCRRGSRVTFVCRWGGGPGGWGRGSSACERRPGMVQSMQREREARHQGART